MTRIFRNLGIGIVRYECTTTAVVRYIIRLHMGYSLCQKYKMIYNNNRYILGNALMLRVRISTLNLGHLLWQQWWRFDDYFFAKHNYNNRYRVLLMFYKCARKAVKKKCFFFCYSVLVDLDGCNNIVDFKSSVVTVKRFQPITHDSNLTYLQFFFSKPSCWIVRIAHDRCVSRMPESHPGRGKTVIGNIYV